MRPGTHWWRRGGPMKERNREQLSERVLLYILLLPRQLVDSESAPAETMPIQADKAHSQEANEGRNEKEVVVV